MALTYKDIGMVRFPIYAVSSGDWYGQDGLLFLENKILDDKNMGGKSLGMRRLQTPHKNLYPLRYQLDDLRGLIKSSKKTFVDSNGAIFNYIKTEFVSLKYYKIERVEKLEKAVRLRIERVKKPFIVPRPPASEIQYAGLLHYGIRPWMLYEYSETKLKDTRRKV